MINKIDVIFVGGHHTSAVPLIKKLKDKGKTVHFIGHKYASDLNKEVSSEFKEISNLGVPYTNLSAAKFYNVSGISKYFKLIRSIFESLIFLCKNRPRLVFTFGGYLSVPVAIASKILLIKVVTHEQTVSGGLAFKVCNILSNTVFLSFKNKKLQGKKYLVVGIPLRSEIKGVKPRKLTQDYKLKTLYIQGGKQGSHTLNEFVFNNLNQLTKQFIVYHQTSTHSEYNDFDLSKKYAKRYKERYFSFDFLYGKDYKQILKRADFLLTRSGAHIVYELCFLKIPAIFVPIPWSSNNEQLKNAKNAAQYVPSVVVSQASLNIKSFNKALVKLNKELKLKQSYKQVPDNAESKIIDYIIKVYL